MSTQSEAKFTKGPWRVKQIGVYSDPGYVIVHPDTGKPGLYMRRLDYVGAFSDADAHLIAAAPELYEALEDMIRLAELDPPSTGHSGPCGPWEACDGACMDSANFTEAIGRARAALARARGES